jgi:hypothetical protein
MYRPNIGVTTTTKEQGWTVVTTPETATAICLTGTVGTTADIRPFETVETPFHTATVGRMCTTIINFVSLLHRFNMDDLPTTGLPMSAGARVSAMAAIGTITARFGKVLVLVSSA